MCFAFRKRLTPFYVLQTSPVKMKSKSRLFRVFVVVTWKQSGASFFCSISESYVNTRPFISNILVSISKKSFPSVPICSSSNNLVSVACVFIKDGGKLGTLKAHVVTAGPLVGNSTSKWNQSHLRQSCKSLITCYTLLLMIKYRKPKGQKGVNSLRVSYNA